MRVRTNINLMSADEIDAYVQAVRSLKASAESIYNNYIQTHYNSRGQVHHTPMFLPWHRAFLMDFETRLQEVLNDSTFALPYWDWTADEKKPGHIGHIWDPTVMGGKGNPVQSGPFRAGQWRIFSPDNNSQMIPSLKRTLEGSSFATRDGVMKLFEYQDYGAFRFNLETKLHDPMHMWVGGQISSVPNSVNDPVFWLHHANVDRIWAHWQELNPKARLEDPQDSNFGPDSLMPPTYLQTGEKKVSEVLKAIGSVYTYNNFPPQCVHRGGGKDTRLWWTTLDPSSQEWAQDKVFSEGNHSVSEPSLAVLNGTLFCVHCGIGSDDGRLWWTTFDPTNKTWEDETLFSQGNLSADRPTLAFFS